MTRRTVTAHTRQLMKQQLTPTILEILGKLSILAVLLVLSFIWVVSLVLGVISIITTSVAIVAGTMGVAILHGKILLLLSCVFIISTLIIQAICRNTWKHE